MSAAIDTRSAPEWELVIARVFDAPRERVFKAWCDPEIVKLWSAPRGFTITHGEGELRPGGQWRCCMRSPEGRELRLGGVCLDILPSKRLVFTHAWDDAEGRPGHETVVTVSLGDLGGKTSLTFHQDGFASREARDGHADGWSECLNQLAELLAMT